MTDSKNPYPPLFTENPPTLSPARVAEIARNLNRLTPGVTELAASLLIGQMSEDDIVWEIIRTRFDNPIESNAHPKSSTTNRVYGDGQKIG